MQNKTEGGETARRALRLIEAVVTAQEPVSLDELGERVGLSKSTCYRLLRVLQEELYVDRVGSGGYVVGSRMVGVAAAVLTDAALYQAARPALRLLSDSAGETASVHLRSGNLAVLVTGVESADQVLRRAATVGETTPLVRGASGLAILAYLSSVEAEPIIKVADDPAVLRAALADIRAAGYAISFGDNHPGLHGIAAPVPGTSMSVALSGPAQRLPEERLRSFADRLVDTCSELSLLFNESAVPMARA